LTLVLMAAGMGSRYGGLKQLEAFGPGGATLMDYGIFDAKRAGFTRVIFVIRREFEAEFRERIAARYDGVLDVALAFQSLDDLPAGSDLPAGREKPWGTGHALLAARALLTGPFCVCNADDFYGRDAYASMGGFLRNAEPAQGALVGFDLGATLSVNGTVARGICDVQAGRLLQVRERTRLRADDADVLDEATGERFDLHAPVSMNFWGFHADALRLFEAAFAEFFKDLRDPLKDEFYLPLAVDQAMRAGRLQVQALPGGRQWFGVTYPQDKAAVQEALLKRVDEGDYPARLWDERSGGKI
jgi:hypothetical protein